MTTIDAATAYSGDAILIRWSEGPKGRTVTFELDEEGAQHPFKGLKFGSENGQRFQLVAVCKAPDETAQDLRDAKCGPDSGDHVLRKVTTADQAIVTPHASAAQGQGKPRTPFLEKPRSQQAGIKLDDASFVRWLWGTASATEEKECNTGDDLLKRRLFISSKRELDTDPDAGERWSRLLTDYDMRDMRK